jgi:hypothetical protein
MVTELTLHFENNRLDRQTFREAAIRLSKDKLSTATAGCFSFFG